MNLLSHYYLDHDHPSAYFKLGLLLPDLIRGFNQKLRRSVFFSLPAHPEHQELFEGIQKHMAVDAIFHNSEAFNFYCQLVKDALSPRLFPSFQRRKYFMAHIFTEMLIDRVLVKHAPQLCVEMKNDLERTEPAVLKSYFTHIQEPVIYKDFFHNFKLFLSGTPLLFYSDNETFVKALIRVYHKINPVPVSLAEAEHLITLAESVENNHHAPLLGIFETVNEKLAALA